jgi:hypothetical protein
MSRAVGAKLLQRSLDHIGQSGRSQGGSRAGHVLGVRLILTCERTGFFPLLFGRSDIQPCPSLNIGNDAARLCWPRLHGFQRIATTRWHFLTMSPVKRPRAALGQLSF